MRTALLLLASMLVVSVSSAEPKRPPRPVTCATWEVLRGPHKVVAMCTDGPKPVMLTRYVVVEIPLSNAADPVGGEVKKVLVGWR